MPPASGGLEFGLVYHPPSMGEGLVELASS